MEKITFKNSSFLICCGIADEADSVLQTVVDITFLDIQE